MPLSPEWRKSSFSDPQGCVEARKVQDGVEVRDSKDQDGPVLKFNKHEWDAFTKGVEAGEFIG